LVVSSLLTCRNSFSCHWLQSRSNRVRAGDPAWQDACRACQCRTCPEARREWRLRAVVFVASAIPHLTSMLDRLRFTWTGLRSMDRPSVVARSSDSANRMHTHQFRYSLSRAAMSTKSNRFFARSTKKLFERCNTMHGCHRKPPRHRCRGGSFKRVRRLQPRLSMGTNERFSGPV
jgi:hypothetical protein